MIALVGMKAGRLGATFERMSDRERKLVFGGMVLVLVAGLLLVGVLVARRVSALEEQVASNEEALTEIVALAPDYLVARKEEKAIEAQLERATQESLQATLLGIARTVEFDRNVGGGTSREKLSDQIKFANATEILAELTQKKKKVSRRKSRKGKEGRQVYLASIDAVFQNVPDEAILRFMSRVESHPEPLFGLAVEINRNSPTREQINATLKIGQFRYGQEDSP